MRFYVATSLSKAALANAVADACVAAGHEQTYRWTVHGSVMREGEGRIASALLDGGRESYACAFYYSPGVERVECSAEKMGEITALAERTPSSSAVLGGVRFIDHENGNRLDNRKSNLRPATMQQNNFNRGANKIGTSRFKGVSKKARPGKKIWIAQISRDGKHEFLGHFEIEEEAARAYDAAARRLFGKFARVNFPSEASW